MTKKTINEAPEKLLPGQKAIADKILQNDLEANRKRRLDNEQAGVPAALRRAMEARRAKTGGNALTPDEVKKNIRDAANRHLSPVGLKITVGGVKEATDPGEMKMANKRLLTSTAQVPETESPKKRPTSTKAKNAATKFVDSAKRNRRLVIGKQPHEISSDPQLKSRSGQ